MVKLNISVLYANQNIINHFSTLRLSGNKLMKRRQILECMTKMLVDYQSELNNGLMIIGNKTTYSYAIDGDLFILAKTFIDELNSTEVELNYDEGFLTNDELGLIDDAMYRGYLELKLIN